MLGKAMRFATVCALAFAICGEAKRNELAAVSKGTTEGLAHRFRQETNFEDHLSNTTKVSSTLLRKPTSKTSSYSRLRRLAVLALSSAGAADAFTAPILTNNPLDSTHDMLRPVNENRANFAPNLATPQVVSHDIKLYESRQGEVAREQGALKPRHVEEDFDGREELEAFFIRRRIWLEEEAGPAPPPAGPDASSSGAAAAPGASSLEHPSPADVAAFLAAFAPIPQNNPLEGA